MDASPTLSLIIPCFNEAAGIEHTARTVTEYMQRQHPETSFELILVNDGSTDRTPHLIHRLEKEEPGRIRGIYFPYNQGRGAAIKAGIAHSRGRYVMCLDADLSYDTDHIGEVLKAFSQTPPPDVVVISPYMKGGVVQGVPFHRYLVSRTANGILGGFFADRLRTVTCVVRGYRGDLVRSIRFFEEGKELHLEMLRKLAIAGARFCEIPGRLIWKNTKAAPRRKINLKLYAGTKQHLAYALLVKPTRFLEFLALALFLVGLYGSYTIAEAAIQFYQGTGAPLQDTIRALSQTFRNSQPTVVLTSVAFIISVQLAFFIALFKLLSMQQQEMLRHLIAAHKSPVTTEAPKD